MIRLLTILLLVIGGELPLQATVVYQFDTRLALSTFIYSDFLHIPNSGLPAPTLFASYCQAKSVLPCSVGVPAFIAGNAYILQRSCTPTYTYVEVDNFGRTFPAQAEFYLSAFDHYNSAVSSNGSNVGLSVSPLQSVPEPSTWAMFIIGFTLAGARVRHRQSKTAALNLG